LAAEIPKAGKGLPLSDGKEGSQRERQRNKSEERDCVQDAAVNEKQRWKKKKRESNEAVREKSIKGGGGG